jgi:phosphoribosylamine-glycine ligase
VKTKRQSARRPASILVMGVGAFAHSTAKILADDGAEVSTYLTRDYAHFAPSLAGPTWNRQAHPNPCRLPLARPLDLIVPMSIDWAQAPWKDELLAGPAPIFCPTGEGMRIERERDFARQLCQRHKIPFPKSHVASNRLEAEEILRQHPAPYVIKNPL